MDAAFAGAFAVAAGTDAAPAAAARAPFPGVDRLGAEDFAGTGAGAGALAPDPGGCVSVRVAVFRLAEAAGAALVGAVAGDALDLERPLLPPDGLDLGMVDTAG